MNLMYNPSWILPKKPLWALLSLFAILAFLLLLASPASAQTQSTRSAELSNSQYIPTSSPHTASIALYNFSHAVSCVMIGQSPIAPCLEYQFTKDSLGYAKAIPVLSSVNTGNGLIGFASSSLASLYTVSPLSKQEYIAYLGREVGLVSEANAQVGGSANSVLSPVFKLWQVSTQFAYLLMIVVFLVVGLMVMFRHRLNPQTVVSIQMALPGLVIGLVLITFSYFLASLITDIAFVGTNVVGYYFSRVSPESSTTTDALASLAKENTLSIMSRFADSTGKFEWAPTVNIIFANMEGTTKNTLENIAAWLAAQTSAPATSGIGAIVGLGITGIAATRGPDGVKGLLDIGRLASGANVGEVFGNLGLGLTAGIFTKTNPATVISYAVSWILFFILLFTMIKLLYILLKHYLSIIFNTILAPFIFLAASFPGRQSLFTDWVRNMLCSALAFPAVIAMFYFSYYILTGTTDIYSLADKNRPAPFSFHALGGPLSISKTTAGGPSLVGQQALPLFGGLNQDLIRYLLAYAALIATPAVPELICKTIGKQSAAGQMIGGAVAGAWGSGQKQTQQYAGATFGGALGAMPSSYYRGFAKTSGFGDEKQYDYTHDAAGNKVWKVRGLTPGGLRKAFFPPALHEPEHHLHNEDIEASRRAAADTARVGNNLKDYDPAGGPPRRATPSTPPDLSGRS